MRAGEVVAVVGAAGGVGRAVAQRFAVQGAKLGLVHRRAEDAFEDVAMAAYAAGGDVLTVQADLTAPDPGRAAMTAIMDRFGPIDVLVCCSGHLKIAPSAEVDWEDFTHTIAVNLLGVWSCIRWALPSMLEQGSGRIICLSSVSGIVGTPEHAGYSAAKGGLNALVKALAREYTSQGVLINAIAPGPMDTRMLASTGRFPAELVATFPLRRVADPDEIAASVEFLAGPGGAYYAGQILAPSGGLVIA